MADERVGVYGLAIPRLPGARPWMQPQPPDSPSLELRVRVGGASSAASRYDAKSADLRLLDGGRLRARRGDDHISYVLTTMATDADLLHPYLAPAAALVWRWARREAVHAGVFSGRDGAVLLLGGKTAGKSTTLAWLADAGAVVVSDDLAVLDGAGVLAGPRCIDLRSTSSSGKVFDEVRGGGRRRVTLAPAPDRLPVAGVAVLEWGENVGVSTVPASERFAMLAAQRCFPALDANPTSLLDLAAAPMVRVTRPRYLDALPEAGRALMETFC